MTTCMCVARLVQLKLIQFFLIYFCKIQSSVIQFQKISSQLLQQCNPFVHLIRYRFFKQVCKLLAHHNPPKATNSSFCLYVQMQYIFYPLVSMICFGSASVWHFLCKSTSRICNRIPAKQDLTPIEALKWQSEKSEGEPIKVSPMNKIFSTCPKINPSSPLSHSRSTNIRNDARNSYRIAEKILKQKN